MIPENESFTQRDGYVLPWEAVIATSEKIEIEESFQEMGTIWRLRGHLWTLLSLSFNSIDR